MLNIIKFTLIYIYRNQQLIRQLHESYIDILKFINNSMRFLGLKPFRFCLNKPGVKNFFFEIFNNQMYKIISLNFHQWFKLLFNRFLMN